MTQEERIALEATPTPHGLWWIPAQWFGQLVMTARKEGRIHDDLHVKTLIDSLCEYRAWAGGVWSYDWISVPLAYTQVVTAAVYSFFVACLFGRQYLYIHSSSAVVSPNIARIQIIVLSRIRLEMLICIFQSLQSFNFFFMLGG